MAEQKRGRFGNIIKAAKETRQPDDQTADEVLEPDNQITRQPDNQEPTQNQTSGLPDNQMTRQPDSQESAKPEKLVNLCVKVPESLRRHWSAESKRQGVTMTDIMVEALTEKFGLPDNQTTR